MVTLEIISLTIIRHGRMSGNYEHLHGSKDLLKEVKDKYDELAKSSYLGQPAQIGWKIKIIDMTHQPNAQFRAQAILDDNKKARKMTHKKTLTHIENKIPDLTDALDYPSIRILELLCTRLARLQPITQ